VSVKDILSQGPVFRFQFDSVVWATWSAIHAASGSTNAPCAQGPPSSAALAWSALFNPSRFLVASPRTDAPKRSFYSNKKWHENLCRHGPCFCPEPGCSFTGPAAALQDHFTGCHKWPFTDYVQFDLRLQLGPHVLRAQDVVAAEPLGHAISLVCVRPATGRAPPRSGALWCIRASQATTRSRRWTP
jgi:hypothetical protein